MLRRICFLYIQSLLAVHAKVARDKHDADGEAHQGPPRNLLQEKIQISLHAGERKTHQAGFGIFNALSGLLRGQQEARVRGDPRQAVQQNEPWSRGLRIDVLWAWLPDHGPDSH